MATHLSLSKSLSKQARRIRNYPDNKTMPHNKVYELCKQFTFVFHCVD